MIARRFNERFPDLHATVGGQTGLDIAPHGRDKSQILRDFSKVDEIHFFGDKIDEGGNDHTLSMGILDNMMVPDLLLTVQCSLLSSYKKNTPWLFAGTL